MNGRALAAQLEQLRVYHRERGHIGKRYVSVIQEFVPEYSPMTDMKLAYKREKMPLVTTS